MSRETEMKRNRNKNIFICVLIAALMAVSYVAFWPEPVSYDAKLVNQLEDSLHKENARLKTEIMLHDFKIAHYKGKIDSLEKLKQTEKIKYVFTEKKIDKFSNSEVHSAFDSLFRANGLK